MLLSAVFINYLSNQHFLYFMTALWKNHGQTGVLLQHTALITTLTVAGHSEHEL